MDDTSQADQASTPAPDTAETGNDAARWARNADDLALIGAAGRGEAFSHEAFTALHRLLRQIVVAH